MADALSSEEIAEALDTIWMTVCALLVFFMHAGFSLLEAGSVRLKNTQNILAKNLLVVTMGFLCWYFVGWAFAYGVQDKSPSMFGGSTDFFIMNFNDSPTKYRQWFFQGAFCATAGTIVSGSMAERTQLKGFAIFTALMTSVIYPIVVYWTWSGSGFMSYTGASGTSVSFINDGTAPAYIDYAGSGIVHMVGGIAALIGTIAVGPRKDRWENPDQFTAHNVPFCVLGTFCLWFGWYGFNPGSSLELHTKAKAIEVGRVAVNTTISPCVAGLLVFFLRAQVLPPKLLDVGGFCNGILGGLVSITASCHVMDPWESLIIGFVGGLVYQGASMLMQKLRVDDVVDAFAVHGACGLWGVLAAGLFGAAEHGGNGGFREGGIQFGVQLVAVIFILLWVGLLSAAIFVPLRFSGMLRLSDDFQDAGADAKEHSPAKAYSENPEGGLEAKAEC